MALPRPLARTESRFVLVAVAAVLALAAVPTVVARAATATPKLGGTCTKAQVGKTTSTLVCAKSGTTYKWAKRATAPTKATSTTAPAATVAASKIDVVAITIGNAPAALSTKVDVKCSGLGATPNEGTNSVTFGPQGGTNAVSFALVEPGATNPTGSTCLATATITGATNPSLRILVAGRPSAGPATGATLASPAFTAAGPMAVTVIIDLGTSSTGIATPLTTIASGVTTSLVAATTTIAGTPVVTTPPPVSGKPEITVRFVGAVPTGVTGADVALTCTAATVGGPFQRQSARVPTSGGIATIPSVLLPATATTAATSCQLEASVVGDASASTASLRLSLNGAPIAGPLTGNLINSPTFPAPVAFGMTFEVTFPGAVTTTTTLLGATTTVPGVTTTVVGTTPAASSVLLVRSGTVPAGVTDYGVSVECTNVLIGGQPYGSVKPSTTFGTNGGTLPLSFTLTATSACSIVVTTSGTANITAGTITVAVNGAVRGSSPGGTITLPPFSAPVAFTAQVTVAY